MSRQKILLKQGDFLVDGHFRRCDVRILGSTIAEIDTDLHPTKDEVILPLNGLLVVPGLINSHDHLEFNLFPRLGRPPYQNYVDWSNDIQKSCKSQIQEVLRVPLKYRLLWGAYKNIFSAVTTVVHHNQFYWRFRYRYPIEVFRNYRWIHSLKLEKRDLRKLITSKNKLRFVHLAEGIDSVACEELTQLKALGGLTRDTILVHCVGLTDEDIETIKEVGAGIVWCPSSNMFLFRQTAAVEKMLGKIPLAIGTDSTLTGSFTLFDELRLAHEVKPIPVNHILDLATSCPSDMLQLNKGRIREGAAADLLIVEASNTGDPFCTILKLTPGCVKCLLKNGVPIFGDSQFAEKLRRPERSYSKLVIGGRSKFVIGDFDALISSIKLHAPGLSLPCGDFS